MNDFTPSVMGIFDRFFKKRGSGNSGQPRVIGGLNDDSTFVLVEGDDGVINAMDRDMYQYLYGEGDAPDPQQSDVDERLAGLRRIRVLSGGLSRGEPLGGDVLSDVEGADAVAELRAALRIVEDPKTFGHCACLGGPVLDLELDDGSTESIGLQHGNAVRWGQWKHDAQLAEGDHLTRWLVSNGVDEDALDLIFKNRYDPTGSFFISEDQPLSASQQQLRVAESLASSGDGEASLTICKKLSELDPEDTLVLAVEGKVLADLGRTAEADASLSRAIDLGLKTPETYFARALLRGQNGDPDAAIKDLSLGIEIDPKNAFCFNSRGLFLQSSGRPEEAGKDFDNAIEADPNYAQAYIHRAQLNINQGDLEGAAADCDAVLKLEAKRNSLIPPQVAAAAYFLRGNARYRSGKQKAAQKDFQKAIQRDPSLAERLS